MYFEAEEDRQHMCLISLGKYGQKRQHLELPISILYLCDYETFGPWLIIASSQPIFTSKHSTLFHNQPEDHINLLQRLSAPEYFTFIWFFKGSIRLKWILHFGQARGKGPPFLILLDVALVPGKHIKIQNSQSRVTDLLLFIILAKHAIWNKNYYNRCGYSEHTQGFTTIF